MNFKKFHVSRNLFPDNAVRYENAIGSYTKIVSYTGGAMYILPIANGATYTCKIYTPDVSISVVRLALYDKSSPSVGDDVYGLQEALNQVEPTLTITNSYNKPYLIVQISGAYVNAYGIDDVMLNSGSTPLPYEPYSSEVWHDTPHYIHNTSTDTITTPAVLYPNDTTATVGLKGNMSQSGTPTPTTPIQPSECGERTGQLFDKTADYTTGATTYDYTISGLDPDKYYTCSTNYERISGVNTASLYFNGGDSSNNGVWSDAPKTFKPNASGEIIVYIRYRSAGSPAPAIFNDVMAGTIWVMVNEGSTALPYEPYGVKIPISSANTTTPVYLGEVETERKIKKLVFDGSEPWVLSSNIIYINNTDTERLSSLICTHFPNVTNTGMWNGNNWVFQVDISRLGMSGRDAWITWLAAQYAAGTPVTVWYVLAEPTTGIVNEPIRKIGDYADEVSNISIPVTAGANTLSVNTTLHPSEITVNYKGWHPVQSVHERENGAWT